MITWVRRLLLCLDVTLMNSKTPVIITLHWRRGLWMFFIIEEQFMDTGGGNSGSDTTGSTAGFATLVEGGAIRISQAFFPAAGV